ncbi:THUMP-like domain-containing protein [Porphyromonas sp.]
MTQPPSLEELTALQDELRKLLQHPKPEQRLRKLRQAERLQLQQQLAQQRLVKDKLPSWQLVLAYIPSSLALEQCSSQQAAEYKQRFVRREDRLLDMTGGLGVDFSALSAAAQSGVYVEQQPQLVAAARYNLPRLLPDRPVTIYEGRSTELLDELLERHQPTLIYLDPARREQSDRQRRVYALEDCEPDLLGLLPRIHERYSALGLPLPRLLVKVSPMLDLKHTLRSVPEVQELHVVAVQSEVKELLLSINLAAPSPSSYQDVPLVVSLLGSRQEQSLRFERAFAEEEALTAHYAAELGRWLYLPHAALMKAGLYKSLAARYALEPLHVSSHLYTSDEACADFPGRRYEVDEVLPFSSSLLRRLAKERLAAQIICRNFPLSADELRRRLKAAEHDTFALLGTTLSTGEAVLIRCRRS